MANEASTKFDEIVANMKTQRDELRVQLHLMKAEAKDEWHELEDKWQKLEPQLDRSADEVSAASRELVHELADAYRRVKKALE